MAQRIKKQLFRILPVSVAVLMIFAVSIGVWQKIPVQNAQAAAPNFTEVIKALTGGNAKVNMVFDQAVYTSTGSTGALGAADFLVGGTDGLTILSVDHIAGANVAILTMSGALNLSALTELTIACQAGAIYNAADEACAQGATDVFTATTDVAVPTLGFWDLNMNTGSLVLNFSEPMDIAVNVNETKLTVQDAATLTTSYTLTTSTGTWTEPATFAITLSAADINAIKSNAALAKNGGNSYLTIAAASGLVDAVQNLFATIADGSGVAVNTYTADTSNPTPIIATTVDPIYEDVLTQTVTATYDEPMNPATSPVITFISTHFTPAGPGGWTVGNTVYTRSFIHDGTAEEIPVDFASIAGASGATDVAGNPDNGGLAAVTFVVDTKNPTPAIATSVDPINIANNTQTVTVTYDEPMNPATSPVITFISTHFTSTGPGGWTVLNTVYTESFLHDGTAEEIPAAFASIVAAPGGATDVAGNDANGGTAAVTFAVETTAPTVLSITPSSFSLADPNVGPNALTVTVVYSETMDPAAAPTITIDTPAPAGLSFAHAAWYFTNSVNDTYVAIYNLADADENFADIDIGATGGFDLAGNAQVAGSSVDILDIDTQNPTLSNIHIQSDNTNDSTLAMAGNGVYLTFDASEILSSTPPPVVTFSSGGTPVANPIAVADDGFTCGDTAAGDNTWIACYTVAEDPTDTVGAVTFSIGYTDLALNAGLTETTVDDASLVDVDNIPPAISQIEALKQDGSHPAHIANNWYYYPGQSIIFEVTSDTPLIMLRACIRSIVYTDPADFCSPMGANYFLTPGEGGAGTAGVDFINPSGPPVGNVYTFSQTLAGLPALPSAPGGYGMAFFLVDEAGNVTFSTSQAESFGAVFGINPADGSIVSLLLAPPSNTTDWSTITDFTDVTGLKFEAFSGTVLGSLTFPGSVNLTDSDTITALQTFAANIKVGASDGSGTANVGINSTALTALNVPANLTISVPGATSQPGMVVYDNTGAQCDVIRNDATSANDLCGDTTKDISAINWNGLTHELTFSTTGFSFFGADTETTPPAVSSFNPANGATGVSIAANAVITFSEPVDTTTLTYTLATNPGGVPVGGLSVAWNVGDTIATISHTAFSYSTAYTLTITAVDDKIGNPISGTPAATFTTAAAQLGGGGGYNPPTDTTLPVASSVVIAGGAAQTVSKEAVLALSATNAAQMMISNSSDFSGAVWETYATSKTWTLTDTYGTKTVYAKFKNATGSISSVISDAIDYVATLTIPLTEPVNLVLTDPVPAPALPPQVTIGTLVKLATSGSVYFIDQDNRRHAFPNEAVYLSYYPDFSGIQTISSTIMAEIPLGSNVTMRPGTYLVKIQSDPKVYAVAPYGVLKGIGSEAIAVSLYGADWATRVVDVEPTFFINYQIGSAITTATLPTGSAFSYQGDSKVYYVDGGNKRYVSSAVFSSNKFQNKFVIRNLATSNTYPDGADLPSQGMEVIMTLR